MQIYFIFSNTHTVIACERILLDAGFLVKVRPVPNAIKAGCGLSLCLEYNFLDKAKQALRQNGINDFSIYLYKDKQFILAD